MASRVFQIRVPYTALLLLAFVAVFGLERTVTYSLQHGKNAQMLAGAILPALIAILMMSSRRLLGLPFAVIALTAGILVHYSILYMAATFFLAWYIVHFPRDWTEWKAALQLAATGGLALALFAFILPEAFSDPRAGSFGIPALGDGLGRLAAVLFARHDQLLFIFNWDAATNLRSPWRGLALIGCLAASACIGYLLRRERDDARSVARMAGVFSIMVLLGIAFATGTLPVGITADFARWYLIFPQIGLILATLAGISLYWSRLGKIRVAARAGMLGIFAFAGLYMTADLIGHARVAVAQQVSHAELVSVRDTLNDLSGNDACFLVTESLTIADGLHTVQLYKPLEYAETLTRCLILNGSFLRRGIGGSRDLGGMPDYATLSSLPRDASIYLVASADLENRYQAALPQARFQPMNRKIGPYPIWKLALANDAPAVSAASLDVLLGLIGERLAIMPDVARHKYNSGAAVEDLSREAQVIETVTAQAVEAGIDKDLATQFFQAQIDASKMIQSARIAAWKAENHEHFSDAPDLSTVIRPKLDALTPALLAALKDALPELKLVGAGARLEAYAVKRGVEDQAAFRRAIAPLIAAAAL
jgi:chorismate mutase